MGIRGRSGPHRVCLTWNSVTFLHEGSTARIREQIGRLGIASTYFGVEEWPNETRAHHHEISASKREGDGRRVDGNLRSTG